MSHIEAMKQALEALEDAKTHGLVYVNEIVDLRQAIAEAEKQEPVAWLDEYGNAFPLAAKQYSVVGKYWKPIYTYPQQNVTTSDMKQEHVDKTAKQRHEENT